jgi:hypothetical protein
LVKSRGTGKALGKRVRAYGATISP